MILTQVNELYRNDDEIKEYIDKYCKSKNIPLHEAVLHKVVHEYIAYLLEARKGKEKCETQPKITKTTTNIACGVNES